MYNETAKRRRRTTVYWLLRRLRFLIENDHEYLQLDKAFVRQPGPYESIKVWIDDEEQSAFRITIEKLM